MPALRSALREPKELLRQLAAQPSAQRLAVALAKEHLEPLIPVPWDQVATRMEVSSEMSSISYSYYCI